MTDDIVAFIRARLDEDEAMAHRNSGDRGLATGWPDYQTYDGADIDAAADYIDHFNPARVLRGVEAKRRMLDEFELCQACLVGERCVPHDASAGQPGVSRIASAQHEWFARLLASEWSTHPDYRQEWQA